MKHAFRCPQRAEGVQKEGAVHGVEGLGDVHKDGGT